MTLLQHQCSLWQSQRSVSSSSWLKPAQPSKTCQRLSSLLLSVATIQQPSQSRLTHSSVGLAKGVVIAFLFLLPTAREAVGKIRRLEGKRRQTARPVYWYQSFCCWSKSSYLTINFDQRELSCCENEKQCQLSHKKSQCLDSDKLFGSERNAWPVKMFLLAQTSKEMSFPTFRENQSTPLAARLLEIPVFVKYCKGCFNS